MKPPTLRKDRIPGTDERAKLVVREVQCRTILSRCGIPGIPYCINPYIGCGHGCVYCYARFMNRYRPHPEPWGRFVDIKLNGPEALQKQLPRAKRGLVTLSSVTDPYQAQETKHGLTRRLLAILQEHGWPVSILTKSDLVLRDIDILSRFPRDDLEVGFSLASLDETLRHLFEPGAPSLDRRLQALEALHGAGLRTWVFIAPVLPGLTELTLPQLLRRIRPLADLILVDSFNVRAGNWAGVAELVRCHFPQLLPLWKEIGFSPAAREIYLKSIGKMVGAKER